MRFLHDICASWGVSTAGQAHVAQLEIAKGHPGCAAARAHHHRAGDRIRAAGRSEPVDHGAWKGVRFLRSTPALIWSPPRGGHSGMVAAFRHGSQIRQRQVGRIPPSALGVPRAAQGRSEILCHCKTIVSPIACDQKLINPLDQLTPLPHEASANTQSGPSGLAARGRLRLHESADDAD